MILEKQGDLPTHPELLDWLARDFIAHGWSLKYLHRMIMTSATYQARSVGTPRSAQVDPENRLLSHFPRRRLDAETHLGQHPRLCRHAEFETIRSAPSCRH